MEPLPAVTGHTEFDAVVIRTDYDDQPAWHSVLTALQRPWGDDYEAQLHVVDDPRFAGAGVDEVLAAVNIGDDPPSVVFLADPTTMESEERPLLAVTTLTRDRCLDEDDYAQLTEFGREFRTAPTGAHDIHANVSIANMGFEEFASWARDCPGGVFRPDPLLSSF